MDWDRYESEATARAATADHRAIADRLREIRDLIEVRPSADIWLRMDDLADELDPPKEA